MPCHLVGLTSEASVHLIEAFKFRGVRVTPAEVDSWGAGGAALCDAHVDCQLGVARSGGECLACPRLLYWRNGATERDLEVLCVWTDADPVSARMTLRPAMVVVPPTLSCAEADRVAQRESVHRLLVTEEHRLHGIICRHDLARGGADPVEAHLRPDVYVIAASATLGEAAAAMHLLDVGCLPVTREGMLVGILTRGDLVRAGMPADLL